MKKLFFILFLISYQLSAQYQPFTQSFRKVSDLTAQIGRAYSSYWVNGGAVEGDGNGGMFYWHPTSTTTADGITIIQVTGVTTGRWIKTPPALTAGSIPFIGTGGAYRENNSKLYWDSTNQRFGIGAVPTRLFDVNSATTGRFSFDGTRMSLRSNSTVVNLLMGDSTGNLLGTTYTNNIAIGTSVLRAATGSSNIAIGPNSLQSVNGDNNTAVGYQSLRSTDGEGSIGIGYNAGISNYGDNNTSIGYVSGNYDSLAVGTINNSEVVIGTTSYSGATTASYITANSLTTGQAYPVRIVFTGTAPSPFSGLPISVQAVITNSNTITLKGITIFSSQGSGTCVFTRYNKQSNSIAIGYNARTTASHQIVIGNTNDTFLVVNKLKFDINATPALNDVLKWNGTRYVPGAGGSGGTDTSSLSGRINTKLNISDTAAMQANDLRNVVLNTPSVIYSTPINFSVASHTATGTLSLNTQTANTVLAAPTTGGAATPTFRALVSADIPTISQQKINDFPDRYGIIYNKNSWANTSDFTVTGATTSIVSSKIRVSGGSGVYTQILSLPAPSMLEYWKIVVKIKVETITSTSFGFGVGLQSSNTTAKHSVLARTLLSTGGNSGKLLLDNQQGGAAYTNLLTTSRIIAGSANDYVILTLERNKQIFTATSRNATTNAVIVDTTYEYPSNGSPFTHNTGQFTVFSFGGQFLIDSLSISSNEVTNAQLMLIGDSKTQHSNVTSFGQSFGQILKDKFKGVVVSAGGSDKTTEVLARIQEIISLKPKQALLLIGSNDPRYGLSEATFEANYHAISDSLIAHGIDVFYSDPMYETSTDLSLQKTYIDATFSTSKIIDLWAPMQIPGSLYTDGVHPGDVGHTRVADAIVNSYKLAGALPSVSGGSGALLAGTFNATGTSTGIDITGGIISLHAADATNPGALSTTTQTIAGDKTLTGKTIFTPGTLADGEKAISITTTLPTTAAAANTAFDNQITTAGSSAFLQRGFNVALLPGYTGSSNTMAGAFTNTVAGTGAALLPTTTGNLGFNTTATATTTGYNIADLGVASGGSLNIGKMGRTIVAKNSGTNIAVAGFSLNTGTSPIHIGVYGGLQNATPTFISAAALFDNGTTTDPILVGRDNGTIVFNVADNGAVGIGTTAVASAQLEILSTTKGFLPPRGSTTQRNAISSPAEGLQFYNSTTHFPNIYNGTAWDAVVLSTNPSFNSGIKTTGSAPSVAVGTGAGTGATASIAGNDIAGSITINTGTTPTLSGTVVTISWNATLDNTPKLVTISAGNDQAAINQNRLFIDKATLSTTQALLKNSSTSALVASDTYIIYYQVIQ